MVEMVKKIPLQEKIAELEHRIEVLEGKRKPSQEFIKSGPWTSLLKSFDELFR